MVTVRHSLSGESPFRGSSSQCVLGTRALNQGTMRSSPSPPTIPGPSNVNTAPRQSNTAVRSSSYPVPLRSCVKTDTSSTHCGIIPSFPKDAKIGLPRPFAINAAVGRDFYFDDEIYRVILPELKFEYTSIEISSDTQSNLTVKFDHRLSRMLESKMKKGKKCANEESGGFTKRHQNYAHKAAPETESKKQLPVFLKTASIVQKAIPKNILNGSDTETTHSYFDSYETSQKDDLWHFPCLTTIIKSFSNDFPMLPTIQIPEVMIWSTDIQKEGEKLCITGIAAEKILKSAIFYISSHDKIWKDRLIFEFYGDERIVDTCSTVLRRDDFLHWYIKTGRWCWITQGPPSQGKLDIQKMEDLYDARKFFLKSKLSPLLANGRHISSIGHIALQKAISSQKWNSLETQCFEKLCLISIRGCLRDIILVYQLEMLELQTLEECNRADDMVFQPFAGPMASQKLTRLIESADHSPQEDPLSPIARLEKMLNIRPSVKKGKRPEVDKAAAPKVMILESDLVVFTLRNTSSSCSPAGAPVRYPARCHGTLQCRASGSTSTQESNSEEDIGKCRYVNTPHDISQPRIVITNANISTSTTETKSDITPSHSPHKLIGIGPQDIALSLSETDNSEECSEEYICVDNRQDGEYVPPQALRRQSSIRPSSLVKCDTYSDDAASNLVLSRQIGSPGGLDGLGPTNVSWLTLLEEAPEFNKYDSGWDGDDESNDFGRERSLTGQVKEVADEFGQSSGESSKGNIFKRFFKWTSRKIMRK